jgi:predicted SAM-dependent methyltransferase
MNSAMPELATPIPTVTDNPMPEFGDPRALNYKLTLQGLFLFEVKSLLGRLLSRRRVMAASPYLQVGAGENILAGFENLDFYSVKLSALKLPVRRRDLRYPLPYADESFRGAFTEHVLEHLYAHEAIALLREFRRVLKRGGILRVAVPDLGKYIAFYNGQVPAAEFQRYRSGCEAIWSLAQSWGHISVWDEAMMVRQLRAAGFSSAEGVSYRKGADPKLLVDDPDHEWETLYVEAVR